MVEARCLVGMGPLDTVNVDYSLVLEGEEVDQTAHSWRQLQMAAVVRQEAVVV